MNSLWPTQTFEARETDIYSFLFFAIFLRPRPAELLLRAIVIVKPCQIVGRGSEFQPVALSEETASHSIFLPGHLHMVDVFRLAAGTNSKALDIERKRR